MISSTIILSDPAPGWKRINNDNTNFTYQSVSYSDNENFSSGKAAIVNNTPTTSLSEDKVIEIAFSGTKLRILNQLTSTDDTGSNTPYYALVALDGKIVDELYDEPTNSGVCKAVTYENSNLNDHIHDLQIIVKKGSYQFNFDSIDIDKDAAVYNYVLSNDTHKFIIQDSIIEEFEKKYPVNSDNFIPGTTVVTADYSYWNNTTSGIFSNFRLNQYKEPTNLGSNDESILMYSLHGIFDIYNYDNLPYKELYEFTREGLRFKTHVIFDTTNGESSNIDFNNDFKHVVNIDAGTASATVYPKDIILIQKNDVELINKENMSYLNYFSFPKTVSDNEEDSDFNYFYYKSAVSPDKGNTWYTYYNNTLITLSSISDLMNYNEINSTGYWISNIISALNTNNIINTIPLKDRGFRIAIKVGIKNSDDTVLYPDDYTNFFLDKLIGMHYNTGYNAYSDKFITETVNFFYEYDNSNSSKVFFGDTVIHRNSYPNYINVVFPSFVEEDPDNYDHTKYQKHYFGSNMRISLPYEEEYKTYVLGDELKYNISQHQMTYLHEDSKDAYTDPDTGDTYPVVVKMSDYDSSNKEKLFSITRTADYSSFRPVLLYFDKWEPTEINSKFDFFRDINYTVNNNIESSANTKILLHFNDENNIFKDSAKNRWKVNGTPTVSSTNAKYVSNVNLSAGDYAFMIQSLILGGSDFTIEGWININNYVENGRIFSFVDRLNTYIIEASMGENNGTIKLRAGDISSALNSVVIANNLIANNLNHIAFVYNHNDGEIDVYCNGVKVNSYYTVIPETTFTRVAINYDWESAGFINSKPEYSKLGFTLEEFRVSGVSRYSENFNPNIGRQFNIGEWEYLPETSRTVENPDYRDLSKIRAFVFYPPKSSFEEMAEYFEW